MFVVLLCERYCFPAAFMESGERKHLHAAMGKVKSGVTIAPDVTAAWEALKQCVDCVCGDCAAFLGRAEWPRLIYPCPFAARHQVGM